MDQLRGPRRLAVADLVCCIHLFDGAVIYSPGRGMPRSLQIRFTTGVRISEWRGTAVVLRLDGFQ